MSKVVEKHTATLTRGQTYYLRDVVFENGVTRVISPADMDHLDEHAFENVLVSGGGDEEGQDEIVRKDKFTFADYEGPLPIGSIVPKAGAVEAAPARTRSRAR